MPRTGQGSLMRRVTTFSPVGAPGVMLGLIGGGLLAAIAAGSLVLFLAGRPRWYGSPTGAPTVAGH